jgi:hypothetical protein
MNDGLPPELGVLIAAERAASVATAAQRIAVRAKVAASVGAAPLGSAAVGAALSATGKALAIVALTLAGGGGAVLALRDRSDHVAGAPTHEVAVRTRKVVTKDTATYATAPGAASEEPVAREPDVGVPSRAFEPVLAVEGAQPRRSPNGSAREDAATEHFAVAAPVPSRTTHALALSATEHEDVVRAVAVTAARSQVEIVRQAWAALSANDPSHALALVDEDAIEHRVGPLAEEREAVRIVALAKLRRTAAARRSASTFLNRYPTSVHRALIERALSAQESP